VNLCAEPADRAIISIAGRLVVSELLAVSPLVCWVGGVVVCGLAGCIVDIDVGSFELISFSVGADSYDDAGCSFSSSLVRVSHVPWELGELYHIVLLLNVSL
jgi:hypothetical protein